MTKTPASPSDTLPAPLPEKSIDIIAYCRSLGFTPSDIAFMVVVADPRVQHLSLKDYQEYLLEEEKIDLPLERIKYLWRNSDFQKCVNLLVEQELGASIRAVRKTLVLRATNPNDPQGIAAARLVLETEGVIKKDRGGFGRPSNNETISAPKVDAPQLVELMTRAHERQGSTIRQTITVIQEEIPPTASRPSASIDAEFSVEPGGAKETEADPQEDAADLLGVLVDDEGDGE